MTCPSFETLGAEIDGALPDAEAVAVRSHTATCDRCRANRARILLLKAEVRAGTAVSPASNALKARLTAVLHRQRRRRVRWATLGAAVAVAATLIGLYVVRATPAPDVVEELVGDHVETQVAGTEPLDVVQGDAKGLAHWFESRMGLAPRVPTVPEARLLGGRICNLSGGKRVPLLAYDRGGRRLSLFPLGSAASVAKTQCRPGVRGFTVCRGAFAGVDYLLVSDYSAAEAETILDHTLAPI